MPCHSRFSSLPWYKHFKIACWKTVPDNITSSLLLTGFLPLSFYTCLHSTSFFAFLLLLSCLLISALLPWCPHYLIVEGIIRIIWSGVVWGIDGWCISYGRCRSTHLQFAEAERSTRMEAKEHTAVTWVSSKLNFRHLKKTSASCNRPELSSQLFQTLLH